MGINPTPTLDVCCNALVVNILQAITRLRANGREGLSIAFRADNIIYKGLSSDHCEHHLKTLGCVDGMGMAGGNDDSLTRFRMMGFAVDDNLWFAVDDADDSIERCRMFRQLLSLVEREECHAALAVWINSFEMTPPSA